MARQPDEPTKTLDPFQRSLHASGIRVTVLHGPDAGRGQVIESSRCTVGRAPACDFVLTDRAVSSFHVELVATPQGEIEVFDNQSRNGTRHGNARFRHAVVLPDSQLMLGSTTICVDLVDLSITASAMAPSPLATPAGRYVARAEDVSQGTMTLPGDEPARPSGPGAPEQRRSFGGLRGSGPAMQQVFELLDRVARTPLSVLIEGPTGTGKELTAQALHEASGRRGDYVELDCTAIPPSLAESVLFGHERGAFTDAKELRKGQFELAHHGTIFLDEVGELPLELQPKLLRLLETRKVRRVGEANAHGRDVDIRVVSATNRNLRAMVNQGKFREDLYHRLAQVRVVLPPLHERREEIPDLVAAFLKGIDSEYRVARKVSMKALAELVRRDYPGNVRELKNTVERAAALARGTEITLDDLAFGSLYDDFGTAPVARSPVSSDASLPEYKPLKRTVIDDFEREYFSALMGRVGNNLSQAAKLAGIDRNYLRDILVRHGLYQGDD